jgi:hypothetical protein
VRAEEAGLVFVDHALSPVQQRNLEKAWNAKVVDRTGLILEIFGERARTREGTLQVELAHLNYQKSRLVRSWTHLERQRGGFGFLGGPGETQIEADRRMIADRIKRIEQELEGVKRTRELHREDRRRVPYPIVALVGYTNAGKSTLFNRLTSSAVMAEDLLFATLDPTLAGRASASRSSCHLLRYGRVYLGTADAVDRGISCDSGRSHRGRRHPACAGRLARRHGGAVGRCREDSARSRHRSGRPAQDRRSLEQDRSAGSRGTGTH